jgi:uncharacterized membrane protein
MFIKEVGIAPFLLILHLTTHKTFFYRKERLSVCARSDTGNTGLKLRN